MSVNIFVAKQRVREYSRGLFRDIDPSRPAQKIHAEIQEVYDRELSGFVRSYIDDPAGIGEDGMDETIEVRYDSAVLNEEKITVRRFLHIMNGEIADEATERFGEDVLESGGAL